MSCNKRNILGKWLPTKLQAKALLWNTTADDIVDELLQREAKCKTVWSSHHGLEQTVWCGTTQATLHKAPILCYNGPMPGPGVMLAWLSFIFSKSFFVSILLLCLPLWLSTNHRRVHIVAKAGHTWPEIWVLMHSLSFIGNWDWNR